LTGARYLLCGAAAVVVGSSMAATVVLTPTRDNSLYSDLPANSNGAGAHLFAGKTASFHSRRALLAFDVARTIPPGSTITSVTLILKVSKSPNVGTLDDHGFALHRLLADWGEGASDAEDPEGTGAPAEAGDATWLHRFHDTAAWSAVGGDFAPLSSAFLEVGDVGFYEWETTPALVADVQSWLDVPATDHGWVLIGDELDLQTARRFDSRQHPDVLVRPRLTVEFEPGPAASGAVPDGDEVPGEPLRLARPTPDSIHLSWGPSCRLTDVNYHVYEGTLGEFGGHGIAACTTFGATEIVLEPQTASSYYLVVPTDGVVEGSYGRNSAGAERGPGASACLAHVPAVPVCP
jgi:hypothetical protein